MSLSRRQFLWASVAMWAAGCSQSRESFEPVGQPWPRASSGAGPAPGRGVASPEVAEVLERSRRLRGAGLASRRSEAALPVRAIPRTAWAKDRPIPDRLNPMNGVNRLTVHHEGWTPFWTTDTRATAERLELIRRSHLERMRAGDIGYHLIIDRAGRVWAGRPLGYQGAHVKNHNEHNIGVMLLGNFDKQRPTDDQLATLRNTLRSFAGAYRLPPSRVRSHQELNPTRCPGANLQRRMDALRRELA